jgi:trehalose 6-phosphate phosphatase
MAEPLTSLEPLLSALDRRPFALLSDVDGTISRMAPSPDLAVVTPRSRELLEALSHLILVAVVSGRDTPDLLRMLQLPDIVYISLHGLAWWIAGAEDLAPEAQDYRDYTLEAASELAHVKRVDGLVMEVKSVGLALHYRGARNPRSARAQILRAIESSAAARRFTVREGIKVVELRPPVGINKGIAVRRLVDRFRLRGLVYLGDDLTDLDAFDEVRRLRQSNAVAGFSLGVRHAEAPDAVVDLADFVLEDIEGVEWFLGEALSHFSKR